MLRIWNILIKKFWINRWYSKFVINDPVIRQDILNTVQVRGSKVGFESLERQFYHLMMYYPEFAFIFFWRIGARKNYSYRLFTKEFHCKIFGSSKIAGGLMCFHPFASVINAKSIGKNFQFRNGLTVGNKANNNNNLPIIGDNVIVGAQVVIIGEITIGNNVVIGAGSVVVKDVPSHCVVAGNPATIISKSND